MTSTTDSAQPRLQEVGIQTGRLGDGMNQVRIRERILLIPPGHLAEKDVGGVVAVDRPKRDLRRCGRRAHDWMTSRHGGSVGGEMDQITTIHVSHSGPDFSESQPGSSKSVGGLAPPGPLMTQTRHWGIGRSDVLSAECCVVVNPCFLSC